MRWAAALALIVAACAVPASGPATLADHASTTTGTEISIPVLLNDWPADELTLEGATVTHPSQGVTVRMDGEQLVIGSEQFSGTAQIEYRVALGSTQTTGQVEVEILQPTLDVAFDETDFGTVPVFTETQLAGTLTGVLGTTPVVVEVEGPVDVDRCPSVDEGEDCPIVVTWAPEHLDAAMTASVSINGQTLHLTGQSVQGLEVTMAQPWSVTEGSVFTGEVIARNVTTRTLHVEPEAIGGLGVEECDVIGPSQICTLQVFFDAANRSASDGDISGRLLFRYGPDVPTIETELVYVVAVEGVVPSTPVLGELPSFLWLGDIAGLPLNWSSETQPPGGYRLTATCEPGEVNCEGTAVVDGPSDVLSPGLEKATKTYQDIALETFELAEIGEVIWSVEWLTADGGAAGTATERVAVVNRPAEYGAPTFDGATDGGSGWNDYVLAYNGETLTVTMSYEPFTISRRMPSVLAEVEYSGFNVAYVDFTSVGVSNFVDGDQLVVNVDLMPFFEQIGGAPDTLLLRGLTFISDEDWCQPSLCEHRIGVGIDFFTVEYVID